MADNQAAELQVSEATESEEAQEAGSEEGSLTAALRQQLHQEPADGEKKGRR